jgi:phytoene/squalene synthetase
MQLLDNSLATKEPLLRDFKDILTQDGWTFTGNRPEEKDRELHVHELGDDVVELNQQLTVLLLRPIPSESPAILRLADYAIKAENDDASVKTKKEYDLYCFYVAGLVGEGMILVFWRKRPIDLCKLGRFNKAGLPNPASTKRRGMADYAIKAENDDASVKTKKEYDLYCFYVAGLVFR